MGYPSYTLDETITGLRNMANGVTHTMAAIELLIADGDGRDGWLTEPIFQRHLTCSRYNGKNLLTPNWTALLAAIKTEGTTQSSTARKILTLAAALYDSRCPIALTQNLTGLDRTNQILVLNAIATAMGGDIRWPVPS